MLAVTLVVLDKQGSRSEALDSKLAGHRMGGSGARVLTKNRKQLVISGSGMICEGGLYQVVHNTNPGVSSV